MRVRPDPLAFRRTGEIHAAGGAGLAQTEPGSEQAPLAAVGAMAEEATGDDLAAGNFQGTVRHPERFFRRAFGDKRRPSAGAPLTSAYPWGTCCLQRPIMRPDHEGLPQSLTPQRSERAGVASGSFFGDDDRRVAVGFTPGTVCFDESLGDDPSARGQRAFNFIS